MLPGQLTSQGLQQTTDPRFSPHSVHAVFTKPNTVNTVNTVNTIDWDVQTHSAGRSFINKSIIGSDTSGIKVFINCSLTNRNSFRNSTKKYEDYLALIKQRRNQGKSLEDDEDDDIARVEVPFGFQTPLSIDLNTIKDNNTKKSDFGNIEIKFFSRCFDLNSTSYNPRVNFIARLKTKPESQSVGFCELSDSIDTLTFDIGYSWSVLERVLYFHDDDFDTNEYMIFQGKIIGFEYGKLLLEFEVFNMRGSHVITVHQENLVSNGIKL